MIFKWVKGRTYGTMEYLVVDGKVRVSYWVHPMSRRIAYKSEDTHMGHAPNVLSAKATVEALYVLEKCSG